MPTPILDFVLSTEAINRQGFRVLTSGIRLDAFRRNPVGLLNHRRDQLPVARWEQLRIEGDALLGQPIFDAHDPLAEALRHKYEQGIMTAASIGIRPLAWSDAPDMMLADQTLPTITECELLEVSLVDIPSNQAAVRLHFQTDDATHFFKSRMSVVANNAALAAMQLQLFPDDPDNCVPSVVEIAAPPHLKTVVATPAPTVRALLRAAQTTNPPNNDVLDSDDTFTRFKKAATRAQQAMYSAEFLQFKHHS